MGAHVEIGVWLRNLGLEQYEPALRDNAIDAEVLHVLTEADQRGALGVDIEIRPCPTPAPRRRICQPDFVSPAGKNRLRCHPRCQAKFPFIRFGSPSP